MRSVLPDIFKALSDETRLRIFNLLWHHELSVNEIVSIMGMGQSRISRHLKVLSEAGLLHSRRDGLWVFYRTSRDFGQDENVITMLTSIVQDRWLTCDLVSLESLLEENSREKMRFFDSIASSWDSLKSDIVGESNITGEILSLLDPCGVVADLGCGTGDLLPHLLVKAPVVIGVDKSPKMLGEASKRLRGNGKGIELRIGEIEHLPMRDGEADAAVLNMVLHHIADPVAGIGEVSRILKKGDCLVIVDLDKHENEQMRSRYHHRWLGFSPDELDGILKRAGFSPVAVRRLPARDGLAINIFRSVKE